MAYDNLLAYTDFNEEFKIHTNARGFQLGAVIIHKVKTLDFYGRKLTDPQIRYTVTWNELLRIVETLKEFRTILLSQILRIYTDHRNITGNNLYTDIVFVWRLILEEYVPDIEYIKGEKIIVADKLSRFTLNGNQETTQNSTL